MKIYSALELRFSQRSMAKSLNFTFDSIADNLAQFSVSKAYGQIITYVVQWWTVVSKADMSKRKYQNDRMIAGMKRSYLLVVFLTITVSQLKAQGVPVVFTSGKSPLSKFSGIDLDGKPISLETLDFINPDDIQSFEAGKDTASAMLYVKLKKGLNYKFLSMMEVSDKYIKKKLHNPLFLINGKLVTEDNFLLPEHLLHSVTVSVAETLAYHKEQNFDIIIIRTTAPGLESIRGITGTE
jgi:hypothetical protein